MSARSLVVDHRLYAELQLQPEADLQHQLIPIGAGWPFTPSALDPTTAGNSSNSIQQYQGGILQRTLYPGYNSISSAFFLGHNNYNAFTANVNKRLSHGLPWGAVYTFSKGLGTTSYTPVVANNESLELRTARF